MMKRLYPLLACLAFAQVAHAEITATFAQDPAIFGAGNNTYALQVTSDTDWLVGSIDIRVNHNALRLIDSGFPPGQFTKFDQVGDSGVFGGYFRPATVEPGWVINQEQFTASWSTADYMGWSDEDVGTFYIGAFTFSPDANGTIAGHVTAANPDDPMNPFKFELEGWSVVRGEVVHSPMTVPEPSSLVVVGIALAGFGLALRRKKV